MFLKDLKVPRIGCWDPAIAAMYSNDRLEFGLVINIGDRHTEYTIVR